MYSLSGILHIFVLTTFMQKAEAQEEDAKKKEKNSCHCISSSWPKTDRNKV